MSKFALSIHDEAGDMLSLQIHPDRDSTQSALQRIPRERWDQIRIRPAMTRAAHTTLHPDVGGTLDNPDYALSLCLKTGATIFGPVHFLQED